MKPSSSSGTSSRSVVVTFKNNTEFELIRDSKKCLEGVWKNDPPPKINPKEEVVFRSEAKAGLSGTDASVIYVLKGTKNTLTLEWSNPFVGNPKFVHKVPASISVDVQKREGNNFLVDFILNPPGQTSVREPSTQTELETALKQCNTQLQAVLKVKEGLVVMMRSYEKSADDKSAKILGPQIAEKEQEIQNLNEKKERWEKKLQEVIERKMIRRTIKPERESRIGLPALVSLLARADFEYIKQEDSELTIKPGDIINLLDNSDEQWWYGELNGASGYFPATYVNVLNTTSTIDADDASPRLKSARRSQEVLVSQATSAETLIKAESLPAVSEAVERVQHPPASKPVVCHAIALYEVTSLDEGTISFGVGRLIAVVDNDEHKEQWTGILDGVVGTFPKSSVRVLSDEEYHSMKNEEIAAHDKQATGEHIAAPRHKRALVKFSYAAEGDNELTINKGDFITLIDDAPNEEWWEGESNGKVGFFPKSYVVPLPDSNTWTNGVTSSHKKLGRVLFDYKAEGQNELSLRVGQTVYVVDDDSEEEWWEGALDDSLSTTGFFPRAYVQMISTAAGKSPRDRSKRISRDSNSSHHESSSSRVTPQPTITEHKGEAKSDVVPRKNSDPAKRARPGPSNVGQSATLREKKEKQKNKAMSLRGLFGKKKERPTLVDFEEEFKELEREKEKEKEKDKKDKKKLKTSNSSDREKRKMKRSGSALENSASSTGSATAPTPRREAALLESTSAESSASDVLLDRLKQLETQNKRLESQLKEYSAMFDKGPSTADSDQRVQELEQQLKIENKRVQELENKLKLAATPREDTQVTELQQTVKRYEADMKEKDERISYLTKRVAELENQVHGSRKSVEVEPSSIGKFELEIEALKKRVAELEATKPTIPKRPTRAPTNPPERPVVPPKATVHQSPVADTQASGNSSEETPNSTPEVQQSEETSKKRGNMTRQPSKAFLERKRFFEGRGSGTSTSQEKEDDKVAHPQ